MHNTPPLASTTSVQTIYTLSKPHQHSTLTPNGGGGVGNVGSNINNLSPSFNANRKSEHDHIMKITQQQPPSLTLPLATTSTITSFTSSTSKINSSTFYPLQNNVTYTLPKNIGGKMSLNSTINSVVSKVPSVISLPSSSSISTSIANEHLNLNNVSSEGGENHHVFHHSALNYQHQSAAAGVQQGEGSSITSKSTTLPKILRTKRDLHTQNQTSSNSNTTNNHNSSSNHTSNNLNTSSSTNNAAASTNYAVSQCFMPAYPKQYIISNNTTSSSSSSSTSATTAAIQQEQQQPTNINNMQTQTITSTLAANYCPEDSHFNQHHFTTNTTPKTHSSFTSSSSSSVSSNNITTTCNTTTATMNIATNTTNTTTGSNNAKQLPVCTTSKNCLNPKEHFLPNDTSLDDDYLSECENCKIAQSSKYYLDAEALASGPQATMTLQRKSMEECKEETETGYYRISHTLPTNSKKNAPAKSNNRDQWFSTIPAASSSSEEDLNE
ncbi:hypothetical protein DOY81_003076 [Sarcophaga bullata]|nr:hypothetical protein DOY81_003076 [Sarcophaga bullata]